MAEHSLVHFRKRRKPQHAVIASRNRFGRQLRLESLEDRILLATVTWDGGAGTFNWGDAANWSTDALPTANDDVVISGDFGDSVITNLLATSEARSVDSSATIRLSTGTFKVGPFGASDLELINGSVLTTFDATTTEVHELELDVSGTLLVDATSRIDVTGKGYLPGRTIGNVTDGAAVGRSGGSHGGLGGVYNGSTNRVYGDYADPDAWGSGGGNNGGHGGGLTRITAGTFQLDGQLLADATGTNWTGGAGGGISVAATTLTGGGLISAAGGNAQGAGGGGRVALYAQDSTLR